MPARKLTWNEIDAVREKYRAGLSTESLASIYKTTNNHILSILTGVYEKDESTMEITTTMPKKVLIALPAEMMKATDSRAAAEFRTRSDLIREALRQYLASPVKRPADHYANVDVDFR